MTVSEKKTKTKQGRAGETNSLLAAGLFALRGAAVVSQLRAEAERQRRVAVVDAHHRDLFIGRTLGLAADATLRLDMNQITVKSSASKKKTKNPKSHYMQEIQELR